MRGDCSTDGRSQSVALVGCIVWSTTVSSSAESASRSSSSDPEVQEALRDARVDRLSEPTLAEGETIESLRAEAFDPEEAGRRGMAFERLDQLALEHLFGVRG